MMFTSGKSTVSKACSKVHMVPQDNLEQSLWNSRLVELRACRAKWSAVELRFLLMLWTLEWVWVALMVNRWVKGLLLQSGGLVRSWVPKKCTSCLQSERKWQCWMFMAFVTSEANAREAASAIITEEDLSRLAWMYMVCVGWTWKLRMKIPNPAAVGCAPFWSGAVEAST